MRQFLSWGIILISCVLLCNFVFSNQGKNTYLELVAAEDKIESIKDTREKTDKNLFLEVRFNGYPLFYDELTSRWFYSIADSSSSHNPLINYVSAEDDVHIVFSEEIIPGKHIPFTAYTETVYREYELAVTTLPMIRLESDEEDFPPNNIYFSTEKNMKFTLFDNGSFNTNPIIVSDGTIKIRGASSAGYEKKGFRFTLWEQGAGNEFHENKTALLGLRQDGDWILYAAYNDREKIRNVFSSNLWFESCGDENEFGIQNGMEYRYIELFFNQQYWGLYALGYPIDSKQMLIFPDKENHYNEFLFKQSGWGLISEADNAEDAKLTLEINAEESDSIRGYEILRMYFLQLENHASGGFWYNSENNPIDIWLYYKLIQATDSVQDKSSKYMRNILYTLKTTDDGYKILFTPWDMDMTWGNQWSNTEKNNTSSYLRKANDNKYEMTMNPTSILINESATVNRVKSRYAELRADKWSNQHIDAMLTGFEEDIYGSGAYLRDMERWPEGNYMDPDLGLSVFREYVFERFASMDDYIAALSGTD